MTRALVTDGDQRPALAIVRALGRRGLTVFAAAETARCLASASKYSARPVSYPSPGQDPNRFVDFLIDVIDRERIDVLLPVADDSTRAICRRQDEVARHCAIAVPPAQAFEAAADKSRIVQAAIRAGIPVPRTHFVTDGAGLPLVLGALEYPVVVKPFRSRLDVDGTCEHAGVHYAGDERSLRELYARVRYLADYPSLIQQRIVGPGIGVFTLFERGRLVAEFAHRRLREKPPAGGVSVLRESIPVDPVLREHALRLLQPLGWHGVAMVEFKQDSRTGVPYLMEVNGRFWGSLQLAVDAGIDFPWLASELAQGRAPSRPPEYTTGVRSRWLLGDLDQLLLRLCRSPRALDLTSDMPSRTRAFAQFVTTAGPSVHLEIESVDDPGPFRFELRQYAGGLLNSAIRRLRRRTRLPHRAGRGCRAVPAA
jgi:predicted ATP-grasp superfamily ATP-dependent carboligase